MSVDTKTREQDGRNITPGKNPLFGKLPEQYYHYALQWSMYPRWTLEESANLLAGCVPHREMLLRGEAHRRLDAEVLEYENKIRGALDKELIRVESRKYFSKIYLERDNLMNWAMSQDFEVPRDLVRAYREAHRQRQIHGYRTPALEAVDWVVRNFWTSADLREPPNQGEIVQALLQAFPALSPQECEMIEHITRHPAAREVLDD